MPIPRNNIFLWYWNSISVQSGRNSVNSYKISSRAWFNYFPAFVDLLSPASGIEGWEWVEKCSVGVTRGGKVSDKKLKLFKLILGGEIYDKVVVVWLVMMNVVLLIWLWYIWETKIIVINKNKSFRSWLWPVWSELEYSRH